MENSVYRLSFEATTGNLAKIENRKSGAKNPVHQEYREYVNGTGMLIMKHRKKMLYCFSVVKKKKKKKSK
jgi:hypothetical protein